MALSKSYSYYDSEDSLSIHESHNESFVAYIEPIDNGFYIKPEDSVPLALNVLGYDRPEDERVSTGRFEVGDAGAFIADSEAVRDRQVRTAAALLTAVDAYDKRAARLATAEKRREAAAISLSRAVATINAKTIFGNEEIGKLREALGRYDAELAN
jgi:hypothetical protein